MLDFNTFTMNSRVFPGTEPMLVRTGDRMRIRLAMVIPRNSIPMLGGQGPYGNIDMGGMFTLVTVRDDMDYSRDPGGYKQPKGTSARRVDSLSTSPAQAPARSTTPAVKPAAHEGDGK